MLILLQIEECCDLLRSLDTKLAIESGDRIISWVFAIITDPPSDELVSINFST